MMNLVILGSPGSGKGTQALMLSRKYSLLRISTGDLLRDAVAGKTELGLKAQKHMDCGDLVPDGLVVGLIEETLKSEENNAGFILDGFPRTLNQAKELNTLLDRMGEAIDHVLHLDVPQDEVIRRLTSRRRCPDCKRLYNMVSDPPKDGVNCDECGSELVIRRDDREEVILNRLGVYRKETLPILEWYRDKCDVFKIDGKMKSPEVMDQISRLLESTA